MKKTIKCSDYIADFLVEHGVSIVYEMIGGMITHLIDSLDRGGKIDIVSVHHEQTAGFAAEAGGRLTGIPGVALATSGPGATNLITAIGSCYFDFTPAVFITGQVNTYEQVGSKDLRQQGFQETDIVSITAPVTKRSWRVTGVEQVPQILFEAFQCASASPAGPVLIDIPMNIQREMLELDEELNVIKQEPYEPSSGVVTCCQKLIEDLSKSRKPIVLAGGGIREAGAVAEFHSFIKSTGLPVALTLMGIDLLQYNDEQLVGFIGTYGNRWANMALMDADLVVILGSRLDVRQTGGRVEDFEGDRKIYHIDISEGAINNRLKKSIPCVCDLKNFFIEFASQAEGIVFGKYNDFYNQIKLLRERYDDCSELLVGDKINPNCFIHKLSRFSARAGVYTVDVGKNQMWAAQSLEVSKNQRVLFSGGMGAMGFSLPAAIGCAITLNQPVVSISGDGGIQCNIQELETIKNRNLPVKIVIINNGSLGMVQQFQEDYFEGRLRSTKWGYSCPDFVKIAEAYGIPGLRIDSNSDIEDALKWLWKDDAPRLINIIISHELKLYPKVMFDQPLNVMFPEK